MTLRAIRSQNLSLLFQFILREFLNAVSLFEARDFSKLAPLSPLSGHFRPPSPLEKLHAYLAAFPRDVAPLQQAAQKALAGAGAGDENSVCVALKEIRALLLDELITFRDDENVLFFLLRHQAEFDHVYSASMVSKTLETLFAEGLGAASNFLTGRFERRGFYHLIPLISQKIERLAS